MSPEAVKRSVSAVENPGDNVHSLRKLGVVIVGNVFNATYHFDSSKRLVSVILDKTGDQNFGLLHISGNETSLVAYERLISFFRNKYGPEKSRSLKSQDTGFPGLSANTEWSVDSGRLFISISPVTASTSTLSLGLQLARWTL